MYKSDELAKRLRDSTEWYHGDCELKMKCADSIEELEEALEACANALNVVAWGGEFTCFVDAQWDTVNNALDKACATLEKLKGKV